MPSEVASDTTLHGGEVAVSSTVGEGSTFTVSWPTVRPPSPLNR